VATVNLNSRRVFLTGCTGQIGSRLTLRLLDLGYEVFGVRGSKNCMINDRRHSCKAINLLDPSESTGMQEIRPDLLVHTSWITKPNQFWESNVNSDWMEASKRLVKEFEQSRGSYLVMLGSCAEYSWNTAIPLNEKSFELPESIYGKAKLDLLNWIRSRNLKFLWARTFFQFGLDEPEGRLIPSAIDSLLKGNQFVIRSGTDIRDFVFVDDLSRILSILISGEQTGVVNLGSGMGVSVGEVGRSIARLINREDLLIIEQSQLQKSFVVSDPAKLEAMIKNLDWTPLNSALIHSIDARKAKYSRSAD
jgi:UDP-glucuronate decarboxylase